MLHTYYLDGKLKRVDYAGTGQYVAYTYDAAGRRVSMFDTRLTTDTVGGQTFTWAYDKLDRMTTETYPDGSVVAWRYDALGRRSTMTDPDGRVTAYSYANQPGLKRLLRISDAFRQSANYYYDADGRLSEEVYRQMDNDLSVNYWNYDSAGRVGSLGHYSYGEMAIIRTEQYTYNAASMRTRIDYASDGFVQPYHKLYSYDALGQLTQEHKRWAGSNASAYRYAYTYDPAGNRTQLVHYNGSSTQTVASTYNDGNQLVTQGGEPASYDANGNMNVFSDLIDYDHNADNRLTAASNNMGGAALYYYDALGRRIGRRSGDGTVYTRYYYDGLNILMTRESSPATGGAWRTRKAYTLKQASIGQIIAEHTATAWASNGSHSVWTHQFYHFDLLGNTTAQTDSNGWVTNIIDMEAFGTVLEGGQAGFRLTTKEYDPEAGAYYFNARWYEPYKQIWNEPEPTGLDGYNLYMFCLRSPGALVDTNGLQAQFAGGGNKSDGSNLIDILLHPIKSLGPTSGRKNKDKCPDPKCKPCIPPVNSTAGRFDKVPPSKTDWPHPGSHTHVFYMNQAPFPNCRCFWSEGAILGGPIPDLPSITDAQGGGVR